MPAVGAQRL
jgi:hypothetical protein